MIGLNHRLINIAAWATGITTLNLVHVHPGPAATWIGGAICYAVARWPDIDNPDSAPGHRLNRIIPSASTWIESMFGHRGITHWGGTAVSLGTLTGTLAVMVDPSLWWIGLAVGVGLLLHIACDCLTWLGAPLLAPFRMRMVRPRYGRRFECGGRFERTVVTPTTFVWCMLSLVSVVLTSMHQVSALGVNL
jgi:membrane-bound metal-dependent hydrolase YbcI (DUF457 family)